MTSASRKRQDLVLVMSRSGGTSLGSLTISLFPVSGRRQQVGSQRAQWRALGDASPGHKSLAARVVGGFIFLFFRYGIFLEDLQGGGRGGVA